MIIHYHISMVRTSLKTFSQLRHQVQQYQNLKEERVLVVSILKDLEKLVKELVRSRLIHPKEPIELTRFGLKILEKMKKSSHFYNNDYLIYTKDMPQWKLSR